MTLLLLQQDLVATVFDDQGVKGMFRRVSIDRSAHDSARRAYFSRGSGSTRQQQVVGHWTLWQVSEALNSGYPQALSAYSSKNECLTGAGGWSLSWRQGSDSRSNHL